MSFCLYIVLTIFLHHSNCQPLLFPHGWFDSAKLRPRDAIYLNLMAQSHLEYGGTTLEELNRLEEVRKIVPRPENLGRLREEDDPSLDVQGKQAEGGDEESMNETTIATIKPKAFAQVQLRDKKSTSLEEMSANPFEEIATRAPSNGQLAFQRARRRLRGKKLKRRRNKNAFLTRDDIIKPKPSQPSRKVIETTTHVGPSQEDREEFEYKPAPPLKPHPTLIETSESSEEIKEFDDPYTRLFRKADQEADLIDNGSNFKREAGTPIGQFAPTPPSPKNLPRLPNNPFRHVDISKPTVLNLPTPPPDKR